MYIGKANNIPVLDFDLSDTHSTALSYSLVIGLLQERSSGADLVAETFLNHLSQGNEE